MNSIFTGSHSTIIRRAQLIARRGRTRWEFYGYFVLLALMLLSAVADGLGLFLISPIINGFSSSGDVDNSLPTLLKIIVSEPPDGISKQDYLLLLFAFTILITFFLRISVIYVQLRIAKTAGSRLSKILLDNIFDRDYLSIRNLNRYGLTISALSKVDTVVSGAFLGMVNITYAFISVFGITVSLMYIYPMYTSIALCLLILIYYFLTKQVGPILVSCGMGVNIASEAVVQRLEDLFNGLRVMKIYGYYRSVIAELLRYDVERRNLNLISSLIASVPRHAIEFTFMLVCLLIFVTADQESGFSQITQLSAVATLVFAFQRLIPMMHQGYVSLSGLSAASASVMEVASYLDDDAETKDKRFSNPLKAIPTVKFDTLELRGINFEYVGGVKVIEDGNVTFRRGYKYALIGKSGSGKSTIIDILCGLVSPNDGHVSINGTLAGTHELRSWAEENISIVDQFCFVSNQSLAANITLSHDPSKIDLARLKSVCEIVDLQDLVGRLPNGYAEHVGSKNFCPSGGERQRIAIARALYRNPSVLIFDEGTSALDSSTEERILSKIFLLYPEVSVIFVTHGHRILRLVDSILILEEGNLRGTEQLHELN